MPDYGTLAAFRTYHTARGRDTSAHEDVDVEAAKLVASEFVDARYRDRFPGIRTLGRDQVREWPRSGAVDRYGYAINASLIPTEIENATYEMALRELATPGSLTVDYTPPKYQSVSIDGALSVRYATGNAPDFQKQFQIVDEILAPLFSDVAQSALSGDIAR